MNQVGKRLICFLVLTFIIQTVNFGKMVYGSEQNPALILAWGASGETVREIQSRLTQWGYYDGPIDGIYGSKTLEAVKYFQRNNRLKEDGIVGQKTLEAIGISVNTVLPITAEMSNPTISSHENDVWLLARAINGEGRGESYIGQVAIGAVILNRVKNAAFPNTIAGVIYQAGAFDAVRDGQINLQPTESCINAARDALNGWDPVDGALYFWNPKTATSNWVSKLTVVKAIDNHTFAVH